VGALLLVVDGAGWILDEVAQQLADNLPAAFDCRIASTDWPRARNCTLHFIDRAWAWSDSVLDEVDPSNRLIGVWWHGRLDSPEPAIQAALRRLRAQHDRFSRFQVTCSSGRETLEALGVPSAKIVTLPIGVDLKAFRPRRDDAARSEARRALDVVAGTFAIGCFQKDGNGWHEGTAPKLIKGPDILVDALVQLNTRHPIHAVIPGPARGYVTHRLRKAGVPFSAPGMVSREELPRLYHALDLYVSPSRDEGGPAGVLEAMASGVPVASSRAGIPADLIESGVNGLLVEIGDAKALASAATMLIESAQLRSSMAERGLASIQVYDWRKVAARYETELYSPVHQTSRDL
jgi:glycosyltransferase involved in cell wall biosynthesis